MKAMPDDMIAIWVARYCVVTASQSMLIGERTKDELRAFTVHSSVHDGGGSSLEVHESMLLPWLSPTASVNPPMTTFFFLIHFWGMKTQKHWRIAIKIIGFLFARQMYATEQRQRLSENLLRLVSRV